MSLVWASADVHPERFAQPAYEHVLPTGATHLVVRLSDDPLRIYASRDDSVGRLVGDAIVGGVRSRFCIREMPAPSCSVGAALRPGAAELLFSAGADEFAERHTPLQDLWGAAARGLRERLLETPTAEERLAVFETALTSRLPHVRLMHPAIADALHQMHSVESELVKKSSRAKEGRVPPERRKPECILKYMRIPSTAGTRDPKRSRFFHKLSVEETVQRSGVSHRHFIALFRRAVGLAPKSYLRIARFQNALVCFRQGSAMSLAQIAAHTGYSDQSHFNRDFLEFSGVTAATYGQHAPQEMNHLPINRR